MLGVEVGCVEAAIRAYHVQKTILDEDFQNAVKTATSLQKFEKDLLKVQKARRTAFRLTFCALLLFTPIWTVSFACAASVLWRETGT